MEQDALPEERRANKLPIIRLKVDYSAVHCTIIGNGRFGEQFVGKVANPDSILLFHKKAQRSAKPVRVPALDENGQVKCDHAGNIVYMDEFFGAWIMNRVIRTDILE